MTVYNQFFFLIYISDNFNSKKNCCLVLKWEYRTFFDKSRQWWSWVILDTLNSIKPCIYLNLFPYIIPSKYFYSSHPHNYFQNLTISFITNDTESIKEFFSFYINLKAKRNLFLFCIHWFKRSDWPSFWILHYF